MKNIKLIIFDCDGVLVDSERVSNKLLQSKLVELDINLSFEEVISLFKGGTPDSTLSKINKTFNRSYDISFMKDFDDELLELFRDRIDSIDGVESLLDKINIEYCVASNGPHSKINMTLSNSGLMPRFENKIFSFEDVKRGKPAPDLFLYAAKKMGFLPSECIVIEDSTSGIQAAKAAGMEVYGFADLTSDQELIEAGAKVFYSMNELEKLINS